MMKKVAVILVAHGEAETDSFPENFSMIRHTLAHAGEVMNIPLPLQLAASVFGGLKNWLEFRSSGYRSPQKHITRRQAERLGDELRRHSLGEDTSYEVSAAYHVAPPFVDNLLEETSRFDMQLLVTMSPVDSDMTAGRLQHLALSRRAAEGNARPPVVVCGFWDDPMLYRIYLDHLFSHASGEEGSALLLTFHGTLIKDDKGNEPRFSTGYPEILRMGRALREAVRNDPRNSYKHVSIAYLNHQVGGTWTEPSLLNSLSALARSGITSADVFSVGYFSDGTEILRHGKEEAQASPIQSVRFIPCLNENEEFIKYLAGKVKEAASK
ncbi:MAG: ferrochelatase [Chlorobium sp.]|nr:ferrochelatase [Chlorobium sp.]